MSVIPASWLAHRAATNSMSASRLRYAGTAATVPSARLTVATRRSARRHTPLATWSAAAAALPPGRMKFRSSGTGSGASSKSPDSAHLEAGQAVGHPVADQLPDQGGVEPFGHQV